MHGLSTTFRSAGRFACLLPDCRFRSSRIEAFKHAAACHSSEWDRMLAAAFRSPTTATPHEATIPGSKLPANCFAIITRRIPRPFGPSAPQPDHRFAPVQAASTLLARCGSLDWLHRLRFQLPLPSGTFASFGIKAFRQPRRRSARLPNPPDLRSLPAAVLFLGSAADQRSRLATFPEACCSLNLLEPSSLCARSYFWSTAL